MKVLAAGMICLLGGLHAPVLTLRAADGARLVRYSQTQIIPIRAEIHFSTLIILPADEEILDFTTGDKDYWIINGAHNLCYLHPAQAGIRTNLNLVTASGHVYSFLLTEVSKERNADPDLKVFVVPDDGPSVAGTGAAAGSGAQYVRASEVQAYKDELAQLQKQVTQEIQQAHTEAQQEVTRYRSEYGEKLQFDYHYSPKANQAPFNVSAIYHDDKFTYIKSTAQEKPTVYEVKDNKPNVINFDLENGVYMIPKIVDEGYLVVGKKKLTFTRGGA